MVILHFYFLFDLQGGVRRHSYVPEVEAISTRHAFLKRMRIERAEFPFRIKLPRQAGSHISPAKSRSVCRAQPAAEACRGYTASLLE